MKLIILSIFHSNFIFYHKLNKDIILTLLQCSIPTLRYHPHAVFSYCVTVKPPQGIQLCYKPARRPIITWLYCEIPQEACALVIDMCVGQMRQPKIPHSIVLYIIKVLKKVFVNILNLYFCMLTIYNISEV